MMNKKFNQRQKKIRDIEWNAIKNEFENLNGKVLDVGAGTGYAMRKFESMGFDVYGIEPSINEHGVFEDELKDVLPKIQLGNAEQLPFPDNFFQVVYASHSLEHFSGMSKGLSEMNRVLHNDGIAVIIVPTGLMSFVNLVSQYLFNTHKRIGKFLFREISLRNFRNIFFPNAHGSQNSTLIGEIFDFSVKSWTKLIGKQFIINKTLLPCLYPYPDFPQFFPYISNNKLSSSVVFICSSKMQ